MKVVEFNKNKNRMPSDLVIDSLKELLAQAEDGTLQSFSAVCGNADEVWTKSVSSDHGSSIFATIGAHMSLVHDFNIDLENKQ